MKSCTDCAAYSSCVEPCLRVEGRIACDYVSLREYPGINEGYLSTCVSWNEVQAAAVTRFPEYPFLKKIENQLLSGFYSSGLSYAHIAKKYRIKKSAVNTYLSKARAAIALR